jgi:hypothetical protein
VGGDRQGCRKRPLAVRLQATKSRSTEARDARAFLTRETTLSQPSSAGDAAMASIANAAAPLSRHPSAVGLLSLVPTSRKGPLVGRSLVWPCNVSESHGATKLSLPLRRARGKMGGCVAGRGRAPCSLISSEAAAPPLFLAGPKSPAKLSLA